MSFVIYNIDTTLICNKKSTYNYSYETEAAAKAGLTRLAKKDPKFNRKKHAIAETKTFFETIEKKETRTGIVHSAGAKFEVGVNTPWTSGPWSETYWSS